MAVTIYTTPACGYCHQAKRYLAERNVSFVEHDVSRDRAAAEDMVRKTGQMGVPVITIDDDVVVGFDRARLDQLLSRYEKQAKPHFGLRVADAEKMAGKFGLAPVSGALIGGVASGSLGDKAGLKEKDIIVEINSHPVNSADNLQRILSGSAAGDRLSITFLRDGERRQTVLLI